MSRQTVGIGIVALLLTAFFRLPSFSDAFFNPDVAATVYSAQLLADGSCIYPDAVETKPPGGYAAIALLLWIGRGLIGFRILVAAYHLATALVLYRLTAELAGRAAGAWAAGLYAVYSACGFVNGQAPNFETWALLPLAASAYFARRCADSHRLAPVIAAGLFAGAATLMKQQAILIGAAFAVAIAIDRMSEKKTRGLWALAAFVVGAAGPWLLTVTYFAALGCLPDLVAGLWPGRAVGYVISNSPAEYLRRAAAAGSAFVLHTWVLAVAAGVGIVGAIRRRPSGGIGVAAAWLIAGALAVCAGGMFYGHYFLFLVPPLAVFGGIGCARLTNSEAGRKKAVTVAVLLIALVAWNRSREERISLVSLRSLLAGSDALPNELFALTVEFGPSWLDWNSDYGGAEIARVAREAGRYIRDRSVADDTILVYDYVPSVYWYAQRFAPTRHHMNFEVAVELPERYGRWYEAANGRVASNRRELMSDLTARPPKFFVQWRRSGWDDSEDAEHAINPLTGRPLVMSTWRTPLFDELQRFVDAHYREPADAPDLPLLLLERDDASFEDGGGLGFRKTQRRKDAKTQ